MAPTPSTSAPPSSPDGGRRLAAIVFTDIVGYSALVNRDDANAMRLVEEHFALVREIAPRFGGKVIKTIGDSVHLELASAQAATACAIAIQQAHRQRNSRVTAAQQFEIRIGLHLGDVEHRGGDIYGDGVNIAARLQPLAPVGGIAISDSVRHQLRLDLRNRFTSRGTPTLRNIETPIELFVLEGDALAELEVEAPGPVHSQPASAAPPRETKRRTWTRPAAALLVVLLLVAAAYGVTQRMRPAGPAPDPSQPSVAVLPFANTSGDPENEYFSDGLSEELINSLGRVGNLKVIGRTSSFRFKNTQDDAATIGRKLGVGYLVDGSVRKALDRVRVGISLVRTTDGANLWSESYDRELKDIFAVQSEIAQAVTGQLQRSLEVKATVVSDLRKPPSGNVEAYQALLQGNFYLRRMTAPDTAKAITFYEQAIALDPRYALAQAQLARALIMYQGVFIGVPDAEIGSTRQRARAAAASALELGPDLPEAHASRGLQLQMLDYRMADAEKEYRRAAELAPNDAGAMVQLGEVLLDRGSAVPALEAFERAIALDPLVLRAHFRRAFTLDLLGRFDEAEAASEKAIEVEPQAALIRASLAVTKLHQGDAASAIAIARGEPDPFWRQWALAITLFAGGEIEAADEQLNQMIDKHSDDAPSQIAEIYAIRRNPEAVFKWLEHAIEVHDPGMTQLFTSRLLGVYRDDPRYAEIARNVGLDPANAPRVAPSVAQAP